MGKGGGGGGGPWLSQPLFSLFSLLNWWAGPYSTAQILSCLHHIMHQPLVMIL